MARPLFLLAGLAILAAGLLLYVIGASLVAGVLDCVQAQGFVCSGAGQVSPYMFDTGVPQQLAAGQVDEAAGVIAAILGVVLLAYGAGSKRKDGLATQPDPVE